MSYLSAYRAGSDKYGDYGQKHSKLPSPYKPSTKPVGANDNAPKPANDNTRRLRQAARELNLGREGRAALRRLPYVRYASDAYDLWRLINSFSGTPGQTLNLAGWTLSNDCGTGLTATHASYTSGFCGDPILTGPCATNQVVTDAVGVQQRPNIGCVMYLLWRQSNGRYTNVANYYRLGSGAVRFSPILKHSYYRQPNPAPVINPFALPIYAPMPWPVPAPMVIVNNRLNDPIGSHRTNGEKSPPRFVPRRPPPKGEKETKVRAKTQAALLVLQRLAHGATEFIDLIDAFHDALPKSLQAKAVFKGGKWFKPSPQAKAEAVWRNFDQLDKGEALTNVVKNHFEDMILGRANAGADKALNNSPIGRINRGIAF